MSSKFERIRRFCGPTGSTADIFINMAMGGTEGADNINWVLFLFGLIFTISLHFNSQTHKHPTLYSNPTLKMCFNVVAIWSCLCENPQEAEQTMCDRFPHCERTGFDGEKRENQTIQAEGICPKHNHH